MTAYDAAWYDRVMVEDGSPAMEPLETSPWLTTYKELGKLIDRWEPVVDLGCGTGRFIAHLCLNRHYGHIVGVDWSRASLDEADRYLEEALEHSNADYSVQWLPADLNELPIHDYTVENTVFVCSEVLEHLPGDADLELVRKIPRGHRLLLTVPTFYSESHVRWFTHPMAVWERYGALVDIRRWVAIGTARQGIHVCETRRR